MGLLVVHHLHAVLDGAQEAIGGFQLVRGLRRDPLRLRQRVEHGERAPPAELRVAPAGDQLLRLHEELDLADAAAPELEIVARAP